MQCLLISYLKKCLLDIDVQDIYCYISRQIREVTVTGKFKEQFYTHIQLIIFGKINGLPSNFTVCLPF